MVPGRCGRTRGRGGVEGGVPDRSVRQSAVLEEPGRAALGQAPEQLVDLDAEQRDEGLAAGVGQIRASARSGDPEHAVLVDPDDGLDLRPFGAFEAGESPVEVGGAEALLREQGPASGLSGE
jgi:hypothetical protein